MRCEDCHRFDEPNRKCLDGKMNPQTWSQSVEVANLFGLRVICSMNDHRERLIRARSMPSPRKDQK